MEKIKIGVVGCGTIAQIMHLPFLHELGDRYEITAICDFSKETLSYVGNKFNIRKRYINYNDLLEKENIDAVAINVLNPKQVVIDAIDSGIHVFVEKPLAHNLSDAGEILKAIEHSKKILMVGYMKRYDPGFEKALEYFTNMKDEVQLIRVHVLGAAKSKNLPIQIQNVYSIFEPKDILQEVQEKQLEIFRENLSKAIKSSNPVLVNAYRNLLMICCHNSNILRAGFGSPERVLFTDISREGGFINSILQYPNDVRCVWEVGGWLGPKARTWWDEQLAVYGKYQTVILDFPNTYTKYVPAKITVKSSDNGAVVVSQITSSYEDSFRREWLHFYECVLNDDEPRTNGKDAQGDIELMVDILKAARLSA